MFAAVQNLITLLLVAFSIALWTSIFVFWFNNVAEERQQLYHQPAFQGECI